MPRQKIDINTHIFNCHESPYHILLSILSAHPIEKATPEMMNNAAAITEAMSSGPIHRLPVVRRTRMTVEVTAETIPKVSNVHLARKVLRDRDNSWVMLEDYNKTTERC